MTARGFSGSQVRGVLVEVREPAARGISGSPVRGVLVIGREREIPRDVGISSTGRARSWTAHGGRYIKAGSKRVNVCGSPMMGGTRDGGIYSKGVLVDGRERAARGMSGSRVRGVLVEGPGRAVREAGSRVGACLWKAEDGRHAGR